MKRKAQPIKTIFESAVMGHMFKHVLQQNNVVISKVSYLQSENI